MSNFQLVINNIDKLAQEKLDELNLVADQNLSWLIETFRQTKSKLNNYNQIGISCPPSTMKISKFKSKINENTKANTIDQVDDEVHDELFAEIDLQLNENNNINDNTSSLENLELSIHTDTNKNLDLLDLNTPQKKAEDSQKDTDTSSDKNMNNNKVIANETIPEKNKTNNENDSTKDKAIEKSKESVSTSNQKTLTEASTVIFSPILTRRQREALKLTSKNANDIKPQKKSKKLSKRKLRRNKKM